jgi:hypothetical protein
MLEQGLPGVPAMNVNLFVKSTFELYGISVDAEPPDKPLIRLGAYSKQRTTLGTF